MAGKTRPKEVRIAEIDTKIAKYKGYIQELEVKKEEILNPKPRARKPSVNAVIKQAKELGMTTEEIAKKLGIKME